jgi:hypothetical protein
MVLMSMLQMKSLRRQTCRKYSCQDVTSIRDCNSQKSPLGNGGDGILEITAQIGASVDARAGREEDGEDGEEGVRLPRQLVVREVRPHVRLKVFLQSYCTLEKVT